MEEWKSVVGYEGLYEVSNLGRIKRVPSVIKYKNCGLRKYPGKILKQEKTLDGYLRVVLSSNGIKKRFMSHILVATAFIDNIGNKHFVNHKNGVRFDNRAINLEWCTKSENEIHAIYVLGKTMVGKTHPKQIECLDTGEVFKSMNQCVKSIGGCACIEGLKKAIHTNRPYHNKRYKIAKPL